MGTPIELWKKWGGRTVGKFRLGRWLGSSDHSAVFFTELTEKPTQKPAAAVKLISAENLDEVAQLSRWASAARLSHPHLLRLFEYGRCQIDDTRLLYVVMEYAEENLAEVLPLRPLSASEAADMLRPTAEALAYLHQAGFAHSRIKPSNIMAVDNRLKISADGLQKTGERGDARAPSAYDAPEVATAGVSPAADIWSLGATLVAVLTQKEPKGDREVLAVPSTIPQPLRGIAQRCLQADPQQRGTAGDILSQLQPRARQLPEVQPRAAVAERVAEAPTQQSSRRWIVIAVAVAAVFLAIMAGNRFLVHAPSIPAAETHPASSQAPADVPAAQSPAPFSPKEKPAPKSGTKGSVLEQVLPEVSPSAQHTIDGRLKVGVRVSVDAAGNVSEAKLVSPGPSKYFAGKALAAAGRWKFNPPVVDGQAAASEWVLRFQFSRTSIQVFPAETKP